MPKGLRKIKIFLASSAELRKDRDEFRAYIGTLNDRFIDNKIYLELVQWEHFLDTVSPTRLQDEYNKAIKKCDITVFLFFTKAGAFTGEEFDIAHSTFKATGKPSILIYIKDAPVKSGTLTEEINTLFAFKKRLKDLGHFFTPYENSADLHLHFRSQLDLLIPGMLIPSGNGTTGSNPPATAPVPVSLPVKQPKSEILILIDTDIDKAFEILDEIFKGNSTYNDLGNQYVDRPIGFSLLEFRSKLKRFVNINWK